MKPLDLILSLLPQLSKRERELVAQELMIVTNPCKTLGHKFKLTAKYNGWFFARYKIICERCGKGIWI